jgi:hypothetical protein
MCKAGAVDRFSDRVAGRPDGGEAFEAELADLINLAALDSPIDLGAGINVASEADEEPDAVHSPKSSRGVFDASALGNWAHGFGLLLEQSVQVGTQYVFGAFQLPDFGALGFDAIINGFNIERLRVG